MPERRKTINKLEEAGGGYSFAAEAIKRRGGTGANVGNTTAPPEDNAESKTQQEELQEMVSNLREDLTSIQSRVTNAEDVTDASDVTVVDPRIGTDSSERIISQSPADMMALLEKQRQDEMERMQQDLDTSKAEREGLVNKLGGVFEDRPSAEETVRQERGALGVGLMLEQQQQTLNNIQNLQTRAISLVEQRDAAIGMAGQQAVSTPFITGHQNRIAENYDRRIATVSEQIGASSAYLQAQYGQVEQARGLISDIVDAQTYDTQMELKKMDMFLELNRDEIGMLDREYQRELQESQKYWEDRLNVEREERSAVLELMIQYPDAAVSANDSLEDAVRKTSEYTGAQIDSDVKELMMQYPTAGITEEDSFASAISKIAQIPQTPEKPQIFGSASEGYYEQYLDTETNQWKTRQIISPNGGFDWGSFSESEIEQLMNESGWLQEEGLSPEASMVLNNPSLLEQYTPTRRGELLDEIARSGIESETVAQEAARRMVGGALNTIETMKGQTSFVGGIVKGTPLVSDAVGYVGEFLGKDPEWGGTGIKRATGFTGAIHPLGLVRGTAGRDARSYLDTLQAQLTLPNLELLRGLGRMSQEQFRTLAEASHTLEHTLSTDAFLSEINRVEKTLREIKAQSEGRGASSLETSEDGYEQFLEVINE